MQQGYGLCQSCLKIFKEYNFVMELFDQEIVWFLSVYGRFSEFCANWAPGDARGGSEKKVLVCF